MPTGTITRPHTRRPRKVRPAIAWEAVATSAVEIVREARGDRRATPLKRHGQRLLKALDSQGITVEPLRVIKLPPGVVPALTDRERQVLTGMSQGMSNAEIGRGLFVSEDTVKTHARRINRKLGTRDRAHAVAEGFRTGILRP